jgi:hypothetical protein
MAKGNDIWTKNITITIIKASQFKILYTCERSMLTPGPPISPTNETDRHDITEIWMKVPLSTITLTFNP